MCKKNITFALSIILLIICSMCSFSIIRNNTSKESEMITCGSFNRKSVINSNGRTGGSKHKVEKKTVYLTFDDGPSKCTEEILDILEKNEVCASFFLIGNQINKSTLPLIKRMIKNNFQIGVHTYSHEPEEIYKSADAYYMDVMKTRELLVKKTKMVPVLYRFPYGSNNCYILKYRDDIITRLKKEGFEFCDWNVSGEDSVGSPSAKQIIANVRNNYDVYNEPVVLLHDSGASTETVKALPEIIRMYKDAGYSFGIINERSRIYQWRVK